MPSWQENIIISSMLLRKIHGELVPVADSGPTHVAVYPAFQSGGPRAIGVIVGPEAQSYIAVDDTLGAIGTGQYRATLDADVNYAFPLHPDANTLSLKATSGGGVVSVIWIVGR
jgi:hypothetical protein